MGYESIVIKDSDGDEANVVTGVYTGVKGLRTFLGGTDPVSDLPVFVDFGQHQVHEGEAFHAQNIQVALGTTTVKYQLTVGAYTNPIDAPHLKIGASVYDGAARYELYEGATAVSGGTAMTVFNRRRDMTVPAATMTLKSGVTATGTLLLESEYVGGGQKGSASGESRDEWVLKANTTYIVYLVGLVGATQAITHFEWYEDKGT